MLSKYRSSNFLNHILSNFDRSCCRQVIKKSSSYYCVIPQQLTKNNHCKVVLSAESRTSAPILPVLARNMSQTATKDPMFIELCQKVHPIINNTGISQKKRLEAIETLIKPVDKSDIIILLQYCHFSEVLFSKGFIVFH